MRRAESTNLLAIGVFMHVAKLLLPAVAVLAFSVPAMAQQMGGGATSVDVQVNQLDEMVIWMMGRRKNSATF